MTSMRMRVPRDPSADRRGTDGPRARGARPGPLATCDMMGRVDRAPVLSDAAR